MPDAIDERLVGIGERCGRRDGARHCEDQEQDDDRERDEADPDVAYGPR